jgi:hypothetical protein
VESTQTAHFWLGYFPNPERVAAYFNEVYDETDADREHTPLSEFARDQGEKWYDHDFLEYGLNPFTASITELVAGYSYHDQYAGELTQRAIQLGLSAVNMFVFINEAEIDHPRSIESDDYWLRYVGTVTYRI